MRVLTLVVAGFALSGCATITRGTTNDVSFNSAPMGAIVTTSVGQTCMTPCMMEIPRDQSFTAIFNLEGFDQQFVQVNTRVATAGAVGMAGNVVLGGIIGAAVDASTGAMNEHYPNPVFVNFNQPGLQFPSAVEVAPTTGTSAPVATGGTPTS